MDIVYCICCRIVEIPPIRLVCDCHKSNIRFPVSMGTSVVGIQSPTTRFKNLCFEQIYAYILATQPSLHRGAGRTAPWEDAIRHLLLLLDTLQHPHKPISGRCLHYTATSTHVRNYRASFRRRPLHSACLFAGKVLLRGPPLRLAISPSLTSSQRTSCNRASTKLHLFIFVSLLGASLPRNKLEVRQNGALVVGAFDGV